MSNISIVPQVSIKVRLCILYTYIYVHVYFFSVINSPWHRCKYVNEKQHFSSIPQICEPISIHPFNYPTELKTNHHSSPTNNLTTTSTITMKYSNDNNVPQSLNSSSTTSINKTRRIYEILCSYLPYMADVYFQYGNGLSQANKYLQAKVDLNKQFRSYESGLSVNGLLAKPIQRVTRYPLFILNIHQFTILIINPYNKYLNVHIN